MSLVSLVMPVWAPRRAWLLQAVRSALGQEGSELELIVVDDGCPEPVEAMLAEIRDERLRVLRVEHGGECRARNAAIAAARGKFFRFVDADDVLEPGSTARLLAHIGDGEDVLAYGATAFCDLELRPLWTMSSNAEGPALVDCLLGRFTVRPFSLLFPRRVVEATGEWDPAFRVSQDWDYVLRALEHATVRGDRAVATYYRKHAASATADLGAGEHGARRVLDKYFERHPEQRGTRLERRAEARLQATLARAYLTRGRAGASIRAAARAISLDPTALLDQAGQAVPAAAGRLKSLIAPRQAK